MTRNLLVLSTLLLLMIAAAPVLKVSAAAVGQTGQPAPSQTPSDGGSDSGGNTGDSGGTSNSGDGNGDGESQPEEPKIMTYNPTVTALHSLNALLAGSQEAAPTGVYFLPYLSDFPTNLADTASYVLDSNGEEHRFAAVYDGYFDSEVAYVRPDITANPDAGNLVTSKKVYSTTDNTRTLQMLGYDLLLADEKIAVFNSADTLYASYHPTLVGTSRLSAMTVVMDLYKALGEYEWDIQFVWVKDDKLSLATSPIQEQISILTNDEDAIKNNGVAKGIDTDEGATWVWATRTNPLLYWDKCMKDVIFSGGAHNATTSAVATVGNDVSVSFSKGQTDAVTFGEFCALTVAMMDLYGEPVMTEEERLVMLQAYALNIPTNTSAEIKNAVEYLAAKGIIDPSAISLDKLVTFADMEPILCRIADEASRLAFKTITYDIDSELLKKGYVQTKISNSGVDLLGVEEIANPSADIYNDYFIKSVDGVTNFILASDCELGPAGALVADRIFCNGVTGSTELLFLNQGITDTGYYHFRIASTVANAHISYGDAIDQSLLLGITGYDIPEMGGGVYNIDAEGNWSHLSFDEAGYTAVYLDDERRNGSDTWSGDTYLSNDFHWYNISFQCSTQEELQNIFTNSSMKSASGTAYSLQPVKDLAEGDTTGLLIQPSADTAEMPSYWWRNPDTQTGSGSFIANYTVQVEASKDVLLQSLYLSKNPQSMSDTSSADTCFYNLDGNLLVSLDYLKRLGYVSALNELPGGKGYILTVNRGAKSNVTLLPHSGNIIVGNTMYSTGGDVLFYEYNGKKYINYKACLGWTATLLCLNNDGVISVFEQGMTRQFTKQTRLGSASVSSLYPKSAVSVGTYAEAYSTEPSAIRLTATYPLSNYMVVMSDGTATAGDVLFVVRHREVCLNGSIHNLGDDSGNRSLFQQMTGLSLNDLSDAYYVDSYALDRTNADGQGFDYIEIPTNTANKSAALTVGYVYHPKVYDDVTAAVSSCALGSDDDKLPIIRRGNRLIDLNLNMFSLGDMMPLEEYGTMPYMIHTGEPKDKNDAASINNDGSITKKADVFVDGAMDSVVIYPAAAGIFSGVYNNSKVTLNQVFNNNSRIYYGTSKCDIYNTRDGYTLTISGLIVSKDPNLACRRALTGTSASSIYVLQSESMGVNTLLEDENQSALGDIDLLYEDVEGLVDWDKYTFSRLIENADTVTSIIIIFALAILPRIGFFLFLLLMCLALISDFRLWQRFCDSVFDVYKLLTLGRQTVHTINIKRLFLYSIMAQALFVMIMDGALFNFIEWVSAFAFSFAQR